MSNKSSSPCLSSYATITTLVIGLLAVWLVPPYFTTYPADLKSFTLLITALLILAYFLITALRRRRLHLNLSPLTPTLFLLALATFASVMVNNPPHATKSFLSLAGWLIATAVLAIFSSTLIKINNSKVAITALLSIAGLTTLINLTLITNQWVAIIPASLTGALYAPGLNTGLIFLGLAAVSANFFKKNKLKAGQMALLPVLIIGLVASFYLDWQTRGQIPSFSDSLRTAIGQITADQQFQLKTLIFGSPAQDYADVFAHYSGKIGSELYHQAFSAPLTVFSLYGGLTAFLWLILIGQIAWQAFKKDEKNNHLYFVLLISFIVQFFTAIYPMVLMIQAILIAFATNKSRQTLINLNFATQSDEKVENVDYSRGVLMTISIITFGLLVVIAYNIARTYRAYWHHEQTLAAITENRSEKFFEQVAAAVAIAPDIDTFNQYAALAQTEALISEIQAQNAVTDPATTYYNRAIDYANHAVELEPHHAPNYLLLAQIKQSVYPYFNDDATARAELAPQIISAYGQALLLQPTNPDYLLMLAGFYQSLGEYDDALIYYQQAIKLDPNSAAATYQLATMYEQKGDFELAQTTYQNARQLLPANDPNAAEIQAKLDALAATN